MKWSKLWWPVLVSYPHVPFPLGRKQMEILVLKTLLSSIFSHLSQVKSPHAFQSALSKERTGQKNLPLVRKMQNKLSKKDLVCSCDYN